MALTESENDTVTIIDNKTIYYKNSIGLSHTWDKIYNQH